MTAEELEARVFALDHQDAVDAIDWDAYRQCPTCRRETGRPCVSQSGRVLSGRPDGMETELEHPHAARKRRTGR